MFGLFDIDDPVLPTSIDTARRSLVVENGLYGRYVGDDYHGTTRAWVFPSLWMAEIEIEQGNTEAATEIMNKIIATARPGGMLSEVVEAGADSELQSMSPIAWGHAEFLSVLIDLVQSQK
jgi:GH15 family glucan-1,4-alpha-glucosidase